MLKRFKDRHEGGLLLAGLLADYAGRNDVLVLATSSGGVLVAAALARELGCAMDLLLVRTLNVPMHDPWQPEIILGAVAVGGVRILDVGVLVSSRVHPQDLEQVTAFEQREVERLEQVYRGDRPFPDLRGCTVILATDALVIESPVRAAIEAVRAKGPLQVVVAAPVGLASTCEQVQGIADQFVCLLRSPDFCSLALWYDDPRDTTDDEVRSLLASHLQDQHPAVHAQS